MWDPLIHVCDNEIHTSLHLEIIQKAIQLKPLQYENKHVFTAFNNTYWQWNKDITTPSLSLTLDSHCTVDVDSALLQYLQSSVTKLAVHLTPQSFH